jgi:Cdc6-like AAA superfamily ATPase
MEYDFIKIEISGAEFCVQKDIWKALAKLIVGADCKLSKRDSEAFVEKYFRGDISKRISLLNKYRDMKRARLGRVDAQKVHILVVEEVDLINDTAIVSKLVGLSKQFTGLVSCFIANSSQIVPGKDKYHRVVSTKLGMTITFGPYGKGEIIKILQERTL